MDGIPTSPSFSPSQKMSSTLPPQTTSSRLATASFTYQDISESDDDGISSEEGSTSTEGEGELGSSLSGSSMKSKQDLKELQATKKAHDISGGLCKTTTPIPSHPLISSFSIGDFGGEGTFLVSDSSPSVLQRREHTRCANRVADIAREDLLFSRNLNISSSRRGPIMELEKEEIEEVKGDAGVRMGLLEVVEVSEDESSEEEEEEGEKEKPTLVVRTSPSHEQAKEKPLVSKIPRSIPGSSMSGKLPQKGLEEPPDFAVDELKGSPAMPLRDIDGDIAREDSELLSEEDEGKDEEKKERKKKKKKRKRKIYRISSTF
ncbi:hypothetical protein ADUPG1_008435 [Aduncisulcus paluster]|uniref:Uncharacterized protein n=1 Tax=Aduncisulcus paluster TaxID=2918883 RepID=A0ABQ5KRZ0_9EUKA|nr:hypothetical protein ADUPG1_008435 [Aduncisulcus paluster]|eukprot:gnl/Carplike_NY0171/1743_a2354_847.p1 GENE.gnl/Carplike_NY0171/1743_a2354_847~~gnl/Carplike_NY0171/1743_a2354_847.p1  ORF type:complete len:318 (-),score=124.59 gnl/Carplike_NY0171/1743_a2354_847:323-1276(-)